MDYKFILYNCIIAVCINAAHIPEVYETPQKSEGYNPTVFNFQEYKKATQQDPQRIRYQQQQLAPKVPTRKERVLNESAYEQQYVMPEPFVKTPVLNAWKVVHPKFVTENRKEDIPYAVLMESGDIEGEKVKLVDSTAVDNVETKLMGDRAVVDPKYVTETQKEDTTTILEQVNIEKISDNARLKEIDILKVPISGNNTKNVIKDEVKPTNKPRIFKKSLLPNSYLVNENDEVVDRQDTNIGPHNFLFVNPAEVDIGLRQPKVLQQNLGGFVVANPPDNHLRALNSLIGKNPNAQLHGLQQLLQGNKLRANKDHTPIQEHVVDIPNTQTKPNIKVEHATENSLTKAIKAIASNSNNDPVALKKLQAQLDATANANAEDIIAKAQQKALAHVKAQHEAIARAQAHAEKEALAQIQAQNQAITIQAQNEARAIHAQKQAIAVQAQNEARAAQAQKQAIAIQAQKQDEDEARLQSERKEKEKRKRKQERIRAHKHKQQIEQDTAVVAEKTRLKTKKTHNSGTEEPSETQHHYYTHQIPLNHEIHLQKQPIHQEQHQNQHQHEHQPQQHFNSFKQEITEADVSKFYNTPQTVLQAGTHEHGQQDLQYAAKYSFGYRIRDFDNGNDFGHAESSEGETTKGHYHVLLPDGRIQNVDYYVDPSGYHATVSYDNSEEHH